MVICLEIIDLSGNVWIETTNYSMYFAMPCFFIFHNWIELHYLVCYSTRQNRTALPCRDVFWGPIFWKLFRSPFDRGQRLFDPEAEGWYTVRKIAGPSKAPSPRWLFFSVFLLKKFNLTFSFAHGSLSVCLNVCLLLRSDCNHRNFNWNGFSFEELFFVCLLVHSWRFELNWISRKKKIISFES